MAVYLSNVPEPIALLVLGVLFLVLSFSLRVRRDPRATAPAAPVAPRPAPAVPARALAGPSTTLAANEAR